MQDNNNTTSSRNGRWTNEEHLRFLQGLRIYGKNWKKIQQIVSTRSGSQIRSHAQKFFLKSKESDIVQEHISGDRGDEHEDNTINSKPVSDTGIQQDDMSFYLSRIIACSGGKEGFDFWGRLVDIKIGCQQSGKKRSFRLIARQMKMVQKQIMMASSY